MIKDLKNIPYTGVSIDTRTIQKGDLFFAIEGENFDGHDFVIQALEKGAIGCVVSKNGFDSEKCFQVEDTIRALGELAKHHREKFDIPVIGVTGSSGKTTTKELIYKVLKQKYAVLKNKKNFNNHIGVPLTLLRLNQSHDMAVIEMGVSQKDEMPWLSEMVQPTHALITNIGQSHLDGLVDCHGVLEEKSEILKHLKPDGVFLLNQDDRFLSAKSWEEKTISFGENSSENHLSDVVIDDGFLNFVLNDQKYHLKTIFKHNAWNASFAILIGQMFGLSQNQIQKAFDKFELTAGRQNVEVFGDLVLIDDTYNANPASFRSLLHALSHCNGIRILVAGDMLELGKETHLVHESLAADVMESGIDMVIGYGQKMKNMLEKLKVLGFQGEIHWCESHDAIYEIIRKYFQNVCVIGVKGSRSMRMEKVVNFIKLSLDSVPFD